MDSVARLLQLVNRLGLVKKLPDSRTFESRQEKPLLLLSRLGLVEKLPDPRTFESRQEKPLLLLSRLGLVEEVEAILAVAAHLGLEYLDLKASLTFDVDQALGLAERIGGNLCWSHGMLPLEEGADLVKLALVNPLDIEGIKLVESIFEKRVIPLIVEESRLVQLLRTFQISGSSSTSETTAFPYSALRTSPDSLGDSVEEHVLDRPSSHTPWIIKLVNKIIADGIRAGASDIHLDPTRQGLSVSYCVDGVLSQVSQVPEQLSSFVVSRIKIISGLDISEKRKGQNGTLRVELKGEKSNLQVSVIPTHHGEKVVLHLLEAGLDQLDFDRMRFPADLRERLVSVLEQGRKCILVVGPDGAGKTTTLYAMLRYLYDNSSSIYTIENPVEFQIDGINQVEVQESRSMGYAASLHSVIANSPDVVMVSKLQDEETAKGVFKAAYDGHLVLSSLSVPDAGSAIERLRDLGVESFVLGASLAGVLSQRLVRKICRDCSEVDSRELTESEQGLLNYYGVSREFLRKGRGCRACSYSGYSGRLGIFSFLEVTKPIGALLHRSAPFSEVLKEAKKYGYRSLAVRASQMLAEGETTLSEVRAYLSSEMSDAEVEPKSLEVVLEHGVHESEPTSCLEQASVAQYAGSWIAKVEAEALQKKLEGAPSLESGKTRVLVVDDDPDLRMVISAVLKREQYEVIEADNGSSALEKLERVQPDLVLCDLMMPEMDGREFISKVRMMQRFRYLPVIFLTAVDSEDDEVEVLSLGANEFISKTASSAVMLARIRKVLAASGGK